MYRASPLPRRILLRCCMIIALTVGGANVYAQDNADTSPIKSELAKQVQLFDQYTLNLADLSTLYAQRAYKPAWKTKTDADRENLAAFVTTMEEFATSHGLQKDHEPAAMIRKVLSKATEADAAKLEILVSDWLIKIAHDLYGDKINLHELYVGWEFKRPRHQIIPELAAAMNDDKVYDYLSSLLPTDMDYPRLMDALKNYRALKANGPWAQIPLGPSIKPGMSDSRLTAVRDRLAAEGYAVPTIAAGQDPAFYDDALKDVVIEYQSRNGLEADGSIGGKTMNAMNISLVRRIEQIIANMERLRHMPRSYPTRYAVVNIGDASLKIIENNAEIYHAPVVVGRPDRKTPFIESAIRSVIFNPSWHVPAKIARQDILPKLRKDPHYLEKMGFVINTDDENDPYGTSIDWHQIEASEFAFRLRQAPGELNSLGRIKFDFDNSFAVYMHGTPHEELFVKAARNLSSGCIRLKDPEEVAKIVLASNEGSWDIPDVQRAIDKRSTRWLKVAQPLPLYIIYQTAFFPTPDAPINFRPDVYNYDRILYDALKANAL